MPAVGIYFGNQPAYVLSKSQPLQNTYLDDWCRGLIALNSVAQFAIFLSWALCSLLSKGPFVLFCLPHLLLLLLCDYHAPLTIITQSGQTCRNLGALHLALNNCYLNLT